MSKKIKDEQKKFLGETLNQYDKALNEGINQLDKKNREQNHKISSLVNSFDNEYLEKDIEGNMTTLENSKDGMVIINEIQGNTEVNYCKDGEKELILNGDIDTQGESFVTITEGVDGGLVDVSLEGNTEINLSKTKDPVLVTREFDDIDCNIGKLQYTIDDVTTINDEPGKVDIDRIVGDTMVNHAVNGSEELILNAHINESGDNNITLNGVTSDGGKVDVYLEGNTLVNVSNVKDDYITPTIEDKVDQDSVISLPEASEGYINIDEIQGNTLVNYCTDGAKELTLNGDIDVEGNFVTTTEGVDNGLVDVVCEGNTLVNLWNINNIHLSGQCSISGNKITCTTTDNQWSNFFIGDSSLFKPSTDYTFIVNITKNTLDINDTIAITSNSGENNVDIFSKGDLPGFSIKGGVTGLQIKKLTTCSSFEGTTSAVRSFISNDSQVAGHQVELNIVILEGDWTNKEIPQYFTGMKSVGQDDKNGHKVEIVSTTNNLLDLSLIDGLVEEDGKIVAKKVVMNCNTSLKLKPNTKYKITTEKYDDNPSWIGFGYTANGVYTFIGNTNNQNNRVVEFTTPNEKDIIFYVGANSGGDIGHYLRLMKLEYANSSSNSTIAKHNKKEILLNEPLRSLPNGTKDRFVKIGGKWFIERNCGSIGFNEIINAVVLGDSTKEETIRFKWKSDVIPNMKPKVAFNFYCNNFKYAKYSDDIEGIDIGKDLDCNILRSKLQTQDIDGFKQWVENNPTTIIYELATPIYEPLEVEPTLNTYNDTTHLSNNSIIPCNMQIKNTGYNAIIKPFTLYTVALDTDKSETVVIDLGGMKTVTTNNVATVTTPSTLTDDSLRLYGKGIKCSKVRLLEGDKTNWIPSFFEGMQSSFEDKIQEDGSYKMEVLMKNKNLMKVPDMCCNAPSDAWWNLEGTNKTMYSSIDNKTNLYFYAEKGKRYRVSFDSENLKTIHRLKYQQHELVLPIDEKNYENGRYELLITGDGLLSTFRVRAKVQDNSTPMVITNFMITEESSYSGEFIENKSNSIQLSSIEPLRGVNEIHDRLVFKDGKLMIERNIGEVTIKDNISYVEVVNDINKLHTTRVLLDKNMFPNIKLKTDYYFRSDRFKHALWNLDVEGFSIGSNLDLNILSIRLSSLDAKGVKEWFRNNPTKFAYLLAEPTYEEIPYDLQKIILESYDNGTLFIDTNIPPTKVSFNCFEEELTYLYPATSYTVQFNSDRNTTADITLGGTQLLAQNIVKGLNKITITTPTTLTDNKLIINGAGANISQVVVTDTNRKFGYFEGMKSVGECEGNVIDILSQNKNLYIDCFEPGDIAQNTGLNRDDTSIYRTRDYIKVEPNTTYSFSRGFTPKWEVVFFYDANKNFISYNNYFKNKIITPNNAHYVRYKFLFTDSSGDYTMQIEKGQNVTDYIEGKVNTQQLTHEPLRAVGDIKDRYVLIDGKWYIKRNCGVRTYEDGDQVNYKTDLINTVYPLQTTTYEPIDYNPFEVYSDVTHITTNSTIPCNVIVKNHGYNMVALKENTQYTLYVNKNTTNTLTYRLGDYIEINSPSKFTFTTPETLTDKTLRIDGKGAKVKDLMLIEGTPTNDSIGYFDGLKSSYECEQVTDEADENYGKYKVTAKVVGKNKLNLPSAYNTWKGGRIAVTDSNVVTYTPASDGTQAMDYRTEFTDVDFKKGTQLTLSATKIFGENYTSGNFGIGIYLRDANGSIISGGAYRCPDFLVDDPIGTVRTTTITLTQDVTQIGLYVIAWKIQGASGDYKFKIQLEEGNTATEYEPYFESKQTIYLNSPLLKGDEIVWKDNKIQHYHKMSSVVLDGSDDEKLIKLSTDYSGINNISFALDNVNNISPAWSNSKAILSSTLPSIADKAWKGKREGITSDSVRIIICLNRAKLKTQDLAGFKQWLQQNPITVVYQLAEPYYEEISDYPLKLNVIANSSLSTESTIQVTNISFNIYEETLPYLYPNTKYYITFNADVDRNNIIIDLGGNHTVFDCKVGFNKVEITTPSDTTNLLTFSGTGVNIDHVKVTQQDIDEYFEGMKSVGECEELEVTSTNSDNTLSNIQQLTHEPLRGVGNVKDRYVLIDNKWYIERNCAEVVLDGSDDENWWETTEFAGQKENTISFRGHMQDSIKNGNVKSNIFKTNVNIWSNDIECCYVVEPNNLDIRVSKNRLSNYDGETDTLKLVQYLQQNPFRVIYQLATPVYEEIDYNPFETYADITHISTNSLIPSNMVIKNHGYNCILKPSTKYTIALNKPNGTISAKLGGSAKVDSTNSIFTITTPSTLNDNVLRLSGSGNVKDIMILEGDKTVNTPSYFEGIESVFEQEYDTEKGKYRVTAKVEGNGKESSIIFYLNEPLRGTGIAKDRVFIRDGKVIVQRNCGSVTLDGKETIIYISNDGGLNRFKIDVDLSPNINLGNISNGVANSFIYNEGLSENFGYFCVYDYGSYLFIYKKIGTTLDMFKQWLQQNPTTVVYQLAEPTYEEVECDLSKLVLENYSNSSLIFESNIPVSANIRYSGEVPVVTQAKTLSSKVDNTTLDINENIIPYMCDIDYRIVELQLMNGDTQGEDIELLGIGDIEILGNENVLFNNREDKKHNFSYDMLKRDILSQRYSKEEYRYRLDRYLLAKKISDEEYKELEGLLNNGK